MPNTYTPKVGDTVVVFYWTGHPLCHASSNARELGGTGTRGVVTKVGRKNFYVSSIGAPIACRIAGEGHDGNFALPPEQARERHAKNFTGKNEWRSPELIAKILSEL